MNASKKIENKSIWLNEVVRAMEHYTMPDIITFSGKLSYYQENLNDREFASVVLLQGADVQKNPQTACNGQIYFMLQCDTIQVFNEKGAMIFDKGRYLSAYERQDVKAYRLEPDMIPDGIHKDDWINWCLNGYSIKVFTDTNLHYQFQENSATLKVVELA